MPAACAGGAAVALLAVVSGCGERSEPVGPASALYPITVTSGDRPLVISRPPRRIAVLDPPAGRILTALGAGGRIAGMPLGPAGRVRLDRLRRLHPDLIVAGSNADEVELSRAASVTGASVYVAPSRSLQEVQRAISQLGLITARPAAARRLIRRIEQERRRVAARLKGRQRVTVFVDLGFFTTASDQSLIGDLIREAGGANVAPDLPAGVPIPLRDLLSENPQVYVTLSDSGTTLTGLRRHRQARRLSAVRAGRFVTLDARLVEPGPLVGRGLRALARALHPDAFR